MKIKFLPLCSVSLSGNNLEKSLSFEKMLLGSDQTNEGFQKTQLNVRFLCHMSDLECD